MIDVQQDMVTSLDVPETLGFAQGGQPWPGTDAPSPEEARHKWERRVAASPTVPQDAPAAVNAYICVLILADNRTSAVVIFL